MWGFKSIKDRYMKEEYAKQLDLVSSQVSRVNTVGVLWLASLVLVWVLGLIPSYTGWVEFASADKFSAEYASKKKQTEFITFILPGLEFEVHSVYAPTVWNWTMVLFILFYIKTRHKILVYLARAIRFKKDNNLDISNSLYLMPPWWLAPLPQREYNNVSEQDLKKCLSWGPDQQYADKYVFTFLGTLVLLQTHVTYLAWVVSDILIRGGVAFVLMPSLSFLSLVVTITLIWVWFKAQTVPSYSPLENKTDRLSRREMLRVFIFALIAVAIAPVRELTRSLNRLKSPRYRKRNSLQPIQIDLEPGFWGNKQTNGKGEIVHIVSRGKTTYIQGDSTPNTKHFKEINIDLIVKNEYLILFNGSKGLVQLEAVALEQLNGKSKNSKLAIGLLIAGIRYDNHKHPTSTGRPSYRIYDLAAGLALRYDSEELPRIIELANMQHDKKLRKRIEKWSKKDSEWARKWSSRKREVLWAGVPV